MKHRQRRAPLTVEDERIFLRLGTEVFFSGALSHAYFMHSMESDRRDADLILAAVSHPDWVILDESRPLQSGRRVTKIVYVRCYGAALRNIDRMT